MTGKILRRLIQFYCRHAPIDRGKYRLALWAYMHLRVPYPATVPTTLGNRLKIEVNLAEFIQSQLYYIGFYEFYLARYFQTFLKPGRIFVDVGAHVGQYTLIAAAGGMEVHAFEPDALNFTYLNRNLRLNGLQAHLNPCAVTDYTGEAVLFPYGDESIRNNSLRRVACVPPSSRLEIITPVVHLDGYFADRHDRIHIIKADVEGAELSVLRGAQEILSHSRPILILEAVEHNMQAYGYTATDLKQYLSAFGYQFFAIDRRTLKRIPIEAQAFYENLICLPG